MRGGEDRDLRGSVEAAPIGQGPLLAGFGEASVLAGEADDGIGIVGLFTRLEGFEHRILVAGLGTQARAMADAHEPDAGGCRKGTARLPARACFMKLPKIGAAIWPPVADLPMGLGVS